MLRIVKEQCIQITITPQGWGTRPNALCSVCGLKKHTLCKVKNLLLVQLKYYKSNQRFITNLVTMMLTRAVEIIQLQLFLIYNTIVEYRLPRIYPCLFYAHLFYSGSVD